MLYRNVICFVLIAPLTLAGDSALAQEKVPRCPQVTLTADGLWRVVSGNRSRTYRAGFWHPPGAIIDPERGRIVVPTIDLLVGLDFRLRARWRFVLDSAYDPRPLFESGGVVVAGIGRIKAKRFPRTPYWRWIVEDDRANEGVVGLDVLTGRVRWKKSLFVGGSPLCALGKTSFVSLRVSNEAANLRRGRLARYELVERDLITGRLLHRWSIVHSPERLEEALSVPPGPSIDGHVRSSRGANGWRLRIDLPARATFDNFPPAVLSLSFSEGSGIARCRLVDGAPVVR